MSAAIVWFRRDLRLADNPALAAAIATGLPVVCAYVHAPEEEAPWVPGAASRWWLHRSLARLGESIAAAGNALVLRFGPSEAALLRLVAETGASHVCWNRLYEPGVAARDDALARTLRSQGVTVETRNGSLFAEPWDVATQAGEPYRVFTPYWKNLRARLSPRVPLAAPARIPAPAAPLASEPVESFALAPKIPWDAGLRSTWTPGEAGAQALLADFVDDALASYPVLRDVPAADATSRLSPHLHFGEITPQQVAAAVAGDGGHDLRGKFLSELGWREFGHHLLHHFPHTTERPLDPRFERFPWRKPRRAALRAWRRGHTGIPLVDAGMCELWSTGFMHNRVRMVVASFLTKNLRYHWLEGARWFWDTLVDADLANNTQGWQWTAGSGADASPYFRVFNPVSQGEKFDPTGAYVRRWIPALARVPDSHVHAPWTLRPSEIAEMKLRGTPYAQPLVDLAASRAAALEAWGVMRGREPAGGAALAAGARGA